MPNHLCTEESDRRPAEEGNWSAKEGNRRLVKVDVGMSIHIFGKPGDTALSSPSQPATQKKQTMVQYTSPEDLRPFPKTAARKTTNNRTRAITLILTDTPVKNELETEMETTQAKTMKKTSKVPPKRLSSS